MGVQKAGAKTAELDIVNIIAKRTSAKIVALDNANMVVEKAIAKIAALGIACMAMINTAAKIAEMPANWHFLFEIGLAKIKMPITGQKCQHGRRKYRCKDCGTGHCVHGR